MPRSVLIPTPAVAAPGSKAPIRQSPIRAVPTRLRLDIVLPPEGYRCILTWRLRYFEKYGDRSCSGRSGPPGRFGEIPAICRVQSTSGSPGSFSRDGVHARIRAAATSGTGRRLGFPERRRQRLQASGGSADLTPLIPISHPQAQQVAPPLGLGVILEC